MVSSPPNLDTSVCLALLSLFLSGPQEVEAVDDNPPDPSPKVKIGKMGPLQLLRITDAPHLPWPVAAEIPEGFAESAKATRSLNPADNSPAGSPIGCFDIGGFLIPGPEERGGPRASTNLQPCKRQPTPTADSTDEGESSIPPQGEGDNEDKPAFDASNPQISLISAAAFGVYSIAREQLEHEPVISMCCVNST
ncbi:hypothetical protein BDK51DRAFT_34467 [Blyttiomyces helicus]|uniref:Uncharacterized protein n=1 Tax=Blyttiomyces helicus TaxID=388810 RepID=A0A4P9VZG6_9FUNG|nr:hypothetical protein BDK51DRAFT_34467 [Blyttiomyces helicus]|eukprot:RKO85164.1 hypothetical protein BDK51DRAFT_34467 [Blyttiomyces helicus]